MGTQQGICLTFVCNPPQADEAVEQATVIEDVARVLRQDWTTVQEHAADGLAETAAEFSLSWLELATARGNVLVSWTTLGPGVEQVVDALLSSVEARCPVAVSFVTEDNLGDGVLVEPAANATGGVERLSDGTPVAADAVAEGYRQTDAVDNFDTWLGADLVIGEYFRRQYGYEVTTRRGLSASAFVDLNRERVDGHYPGSESK